MDFVKVKQETIVEVGFEDIFDGDIDSDHTNDPFDNCSDKSVCDYNSDNDPFKEEEDYQPKNVEKPTEVNTNLIRTKSQETPIILKDDVKRESSGATTLDFTKLDTNNYSCKHCDFISNAKKNIQRHLQRRHMSVPRKALKMKISQCPHCPFQTIHSLKTHIISRHTKESEIHWYRCHQCDFKSKLKSGFSTHVLTHKMAEELDRILKCDHCSKMFKKKANLHRHMKFVHNKNKQEFMMCHLCDYKSCNKTHVKLHIQRVHATDNKEMVSCEKCSFKTISKYSLKMHQIRHSKIFQCEICSYQSYNMVRIKLHAVTHQEVKNEAELKYRCDKCDYKTYRLYSFKVHKLNHLKPEEIQYFYCYHCEFKAKRKDNLKTHIKNHFKKKTEFVCHICDFKTNLKVSHIAHLGKHSKEQNKNPQALANYSDKKENRENENPNKIAPLKRRKVIKNDNDAPDKSKGNEPVPL